ncbi:MULTISPECIES: DUF413 domain-containing protein [Pseudoalteromonas]|uniref:Macrodomain Ori protein n=1 Tax=Pseudoalteromonas fuliginea TaxID=1872678 RepID=A0ABQ6RCU1_9GAMM|nr:MULTISPECIES: DUF413 domain-containing protein [Pseudoalteromonas]KAA1150350.1 DUF413 domain-containing protein [Pseudoalteromonas fuliginea]KAA1165088.1 DUF413 domain-containing protein [Pseudoalteromonas fuliginea]GAA79749.1 UPF0438 protein yifE [Pseudoalteromonas sp. BSi20495]
MSNDISLLRQAFVSQRQFYDDHNFPRGFSRSGNFTLLEASILDQHGVVLKGLHNKTIEPQNEHQEQFLAVAMGTLEPTNPIERAWIKYLKLTTCKSKFHTLFGRSKISGPAPISQEYYSEADNL